MINFLYRNQKIVCFLILSLNVTLILAQDLRLNRVEDFTRVHEKIKFDKSEQKKEHLRRIELGEKLYTYYNTNTTGAKTKIVSLKNERKTITLDISNDNKNDVKNLKICTNIPSDWKPKIYLQEIVFDWYSYHKKDKGIEYWGDPLFELNQEKEHFFLNISPRETKRIIIEFMPNRHFNKNLKISIVDNKSKEKSFIKVPLKVLNSTLPNNEISSIIFNGKNVFSNTFFIDMWKKARLTHLQVNYVPTVYFNKEGKAISGIDETTINSTGFRSTAGLWLKDGGEILLFWQPKLDKIAPLKGEEGYITPFSKEWYNAFSNLLKVIAKEYANKYENFKEDQITLYLVDEVSSKLNKGKGKRANFLNLVNHLKKHNPSIKSMVTYGFYSSEEDLEKMYPYVDISTMHYTMPDKIEKQGNTFLPNKLKSKLEVIRKPEKIHWYYNVERGISSNIKNFLIPPTIGSLRDYTGFSWWAFASHNGSTWSCDIKNGLNYSMYYRKDNNPIYKRLSRNTKKDILGIPSIRLLAAEKGLLDANLIVYIKKNLYKLEENKKKLFLKETNFLIQNEVENISFERINKIGNMLRELCSEINLK